ncbi:MAG TPA: AtpZ/AtpI family protein [Rhizomicrobium sp.]|nr:AtpZ/AtpI family protein [Rhizomicrobium sp.]
MVRPPSTWPAKAQFVRFFGLWETVLTAPDPDRLSDLGKRLDELQTRQAAKTQRPPPSQSSIAFRFATELVAALIVGGGLGWGIDWLCGHFGFHTRPAFMIIFFVLGAAAGIRNVMQAAHEINAEIAAKRPSDDGNGKETGS